MAAEEKEEKNIIVKILTFSLSMPISIIVLIIIASFVLSVKVIQTKPDYFGLLKGPTILQKEEEELVKKVGRLLDLPADEEPTVATVTDADRLSGQVFFEKSQEGDKVLIYTNARKVILYRPSEDRIVEVGAVNIVNREETGESDEISSDYNFAILNSTEDDNLTSDVESQLRQLYPDAQFVQTGTTQGFYQDSIVSDISGDNSETLSEISETLGIDSAQTPTGEDINEDVDFVVIIGNDRAS